jgi:hypothetical protein
MLRSDLSWNCHRPRSPDWAEGPRATLSPDARRETQSAFVSGAR